jgi:hypothetical protein
LAVVETLGAHHVPDVLVAGTGHAARVMRENLLQEAGEGAGPMRRAMLLGEVAQGSQQARFALLAFVETRYRIVHNPTFRNPTFRTHIPSESLDHELVPVIHHKKQAIGRPTGLGQKS